MKAPSTNRNRDGFTLVELIVVLMILAGLAAILIPAITDMVARTNSSTAVSNISQVTNSVQRYEAQYLYYPDNLDSLSSDLAAGTALDTLTTGLQAVIVDVALPTAFRVPLTTAGITSLGVHTAGDDTFVVPTATALADADIVNGLTTAAQVSFGLETTGVANKYVIFGVGPLSDMNGKTNMDAPVYFPKDGTLNPDLVYGRFIVVFQILEDATTPLERAKLTAVITPTGETLTTGLSDYFSIATNI